jgi:hypothetical protein
MSETEIDAKIIEIMAEASTNSLSGGGNWTALKAELPEVADRVRGCMRAALQALYEAGITLNIPAEWGHPEVDDPDAFVRAREFLQKTLPHRTKRSVAEKYEGKKL